MTRNASGANCPTSTPFRRTRPVTPGIELPHHSISDLREKSLSAAEQFGDGERTLVYACSKAGVKQDRANGEQVIAMPCIGMLPPSFVDFVTSRNLADQVVLASCSGGDCFYRLGSDWTSQRVAGQRDPYLRKRVPREKVSLRLGRRELPAEDL